MHGHWPKVRGHVVSEGRVKLFRRSAVSLAIALATGALAEPAPQPQPPADGFSALPAGPGRDALVKVCSSCHAATVVVRQRHDLQGWTDVVAAMVGRGARGTDDEFDAIIDYLAAALPPKAAPTASGHP
jgi:competence protein ComEA